MNDMHVVNVELAERSYEIIVGQGIINGSETYLRQFTDGKKVMVISDENVAPLYSDKVTDIIKNAGGDVSVAKIPAGEEHKTLNTVETLYHQGLDIGLDRGALIFALGGGVTGDIAGFVAATYMRGIGFIQCPTTLLAMVDASVGGKTGVDMPEGKNLVGAFWQPSLVLIDPEFLKTLPKREIRCGLAEVVKTAMILDADFFDLIEENTDELNSLEYTFYSEVITRCCQLKAYVVTEDEREKGLRAILNYGHTFAHAIEVVTGYQQFLHGEAVAIGMCMAADLAVKLHLLDRELAERQELLFHALNLPCRLKGASPDQLLQAMGKDKKNKDGRLRFVLPDAIGQVEIREENITDHIVLETIGERCDR